MKWRNPKNKREKPVIAAFSEDVTLWRDRNAHIITVIVNIIFVDLYN